MLRAPHPGVPGPPFVCARIYGAGWLGLSLAGALRGRGVAEGVEFVDPDPGARSRAAALAFPAEPRSSHYRTTPDLVILAATPGAIEQLLPQVAREYPAALITDVGGVKRPVARIAAGLADTALRFIGSHPLTGPQNSATADTGLFVGTPVAICPLPETPHPVVAAVERLWQLLGGRTVIVSAEEHDRCVALTSHLPVVTAAALARVGQPALQPGSAGEHLVDSGLLATGRGVAAAPKLWAEILARNADRIAPGLRHLVDDLTVVAANLEALSGQETTVAGGGPSQQELATWLENAVGIRRRLEGE